MKTYQSLKDIWKKQVFPTGRTGVHKLTPDEKNLLASIDAVQTQLEIDYESFLIFVNILFTKIAHIVASIISGGKKNEIPTRSFHDHRKYFLNSNEEFLQNESIPKSRMEQYSKLIREKTEWYDMSLKLARDKLVAHGDKFTMAISTNSKGGIRINKENIFGNFSKEAKQIIGIKKKYESKYSELKNVPDNLWEIMDFFMNYDVQLNKQDKDLFINIVYKTGGPLPTLHFVGKNASNFIEEVAKIFRSRRNHN